LNWSRENRGRVSKSNKRQYEKNKAVRLAYQQKYRQENPEKVQRQMRQWQLNNKAAVNAACNMRSALKRSQTPPWAELDGIKLFYEEAQRVTAETGVPHHVDHILPINGKCVSGLHVAENLQVIPACENLSKGNKLLDQHADA